MSDDMNLPDTGPMTPEELIVWEAWMKEQERRFQEDLAQPEDM